VAASKVSENPPIGFALIRPPGNHVSPNKKLVFIINMDVHHENGTSDAFHDEPDVLFLSVHQKKNDDIGYGSGEGSALNLALTKLTRDVVMRTVFDELIILAAQKFKPNIILVSARYDGHMY
ncbi:histone deacetylase 14 isoform X2, partial [Tanacetum coccineum]